MAKEEIFVNSVHAAGNRCVAVALYYYGETLIHRADAVGNKRYFAEARALARCLRATKAFSDTEAPAPAVHVRKGAFNILRANAEPTSEIGCVLDCYATRTRATFEDGAAHPRLKIAESLAGTVAVYSKK